MSRASSPIILLSFIPVLKNQDTLYWRFQIHLASRGLAVVRTGNNPGGTEIRGKLGGM